MELLAGITCLSALPTEVGGVYGALTLDITRFDLTIALDQEIRRTRFLQVNSEAGAARSRVETQYCVTRLARQG